MRSASVSRDPGEPATLADLRPLVSRVPWVWEGYIPAARISGIAAFEGVGKTRFALDLARRIWHGLPWPDGQPPSFPASTPTLWVCADGQQAELFETAGALGLPEHALYLNATRQDPFGGIDLDREGACSQLEIYISRIQPALVFIDTMTNATSLDLCRARDVKRLMAPIRTIAQHTQTAIVPLLHLNRGGQALGLRIKMITRSILHLERPDLERPERLRLWVDKTYSKRPPVLGVTMTDTGNEYDFDPPRATPESCAGRPSEGREMAKRFLRTALATRNDRIASELFDEWLAKGGSEKTFRRARNEMVASGEVSYEGSPRVLRLVAPNPLAALGANQAS
jgi:hypothetical protein